MSIHAGFVDKAQCALRHAGCNEFFLRVHGKEDNLGRRTSRTDLMNGVDPVQSGQADVRHNDVRFKAKSL
jgi:hypothetical protein